MIFDQSGVSMKLFNTATSLDITLATNDGFWHQACITWSSTGGAWTAYLDGAVVDKGTGHGTQRTLTAR